MKNSRQITGSMGDDQKLGVPADERETCARVSGENREKARASKSRVTADEVPYRNKLGRCAFWASAIRNGELIAPIPQIALITFSAEALRAGSVSAVLRFPAGVV